MIRRLLARLLPGRRANAPRVYAPDQHPVRRDQLSAAARSVTRRLQDEGFKAFIVGGAVRDLLLGIEPKDFDIATDATPEQVKPLFRRAYVIGRRFRLVHVHVGNDVIEVSTFRAAQTGSDSTDEHGRLLSDNVYGSQAEDAVRRDFTINALYFDPATESIWDYVGGVVDIRARRLKLIGPPVTRYREDPVRMLRAVRLAAKLGLTIDPKSEEPIRRLAPLMANVPPARLFDEMQKLLLSGHAAETLRSLRSHGLSHGLQPRFEQRSGSRPARLLEHPRFRAAYDFLVLRGESGEAPQALVEWWTRYQEASDDAREAMLKPDEAPKKRRRTRTRKRRADVDTPAPPDE